MKDAAHPLYRPALVLLAAAAALTGCTAGEDDPQLAVVGVAESLEEEFVSVVEDVLPSVVEITHDGGVGSGVVFDDVGHIVTNAHVVGAASAFDVRLASSSVVRRATLVHSHPVEDLAVIRVEDTSGLVPARFGEVRDLRVGEVVMAIGSPLGLESSVTQGIVSALGRMVPEPGDPATGSPGTILRQTIQTSAPINPGNSGGALVNLDREVVGIPTIAALNAEIGGTAAGVGFAIPGDIARDIAQQIVENGRVVHSGRAALGITVATVTDELGEPAGAAVAALDPAGPAAAAGAQVGDLITRVDDAEVRTAQDLQASIAERRPGDVVRLTVARPPAAEPHTLTVELGELPVA
ncbi:trypsin-like peptidase domain-containing protein [Pseudonocardia sp. KRD-182]|uniref:S1C family serine protease n=1 Tax=Pseudonocardia oceani TaxID=2792013 RepID=UPI001C4A3D6B|nr:trypsin-like peptidase domain-containing protein [Pseudonocardia oceani]MBW0108596.1 trypsin-like peptidase domain-containing protein [Pseudonocardia oceani]